MGADQVPALPTQSFSMPIAVVSAVGDQRHRSSFDDHVRREFFDQRDLCRRSTRGPACHRNTLAINQKHPLGSLAALGFPDSEPPFFAGEKLPSTNTSSQSKSCRSSSSSRNAVQIRSSTPLSVHSSKRRQQVEGEGNCS